MNKSNPTEILDFWFGSPEASDYGKMRQVWFSKNDEFDAAVQHLSPAYQQAAAGELDDWQNQPLSCLALIILLDQFPRNLFRSQPQAFATDAKALSVAKSAVERGFDRDLIPAQRWFIYLPFEHSENLADQERCIQLFTQLEGDPESKIPIDFAHRHKAVIDRFGRFPHRNSILGRESTPEEIEFLTQPDSSFL
ncbi:DUF924 family protein [Oscillatoria sp. FACHB-1406]|uniref:DUF924 family protein n=1 Tax=Oscillatoria sp. FACHB-1406 TaxID=2692846 RepID=UPI0016877996|nr:DUF924 domain-containing protein [Oscillatoria sp. FACHB-1406]